MARTSHWPRSINSGICSEPLERRVLFATVEWIGGTAGNWNNPANWSGGAAPGARDDVRIVGGAIKPFVTLDTGDHTIKSIVAQRSTLDLAGGSLSLLNGGSFDQGSSLNVSGGSLSNFAQLLLKNGATMNWTGGTLSGTGSIWMSDTTPSGGSSLVIAGSDEKVLNTTFRNDATTEWDGQQLTFLEARFINNGVFNASPGRISGFGASLGTVFFENNGTFDQTGTGSVEFFNVFSFTNTGLVQASASLVMFGAGPMTARFQSAGGEFQRWLAVVSGKF